MNTLGNATVGIIVKVSQNRSMQKPFISFIPVLLRREIVPQRVNCHKCGAVLYEGIELKTPYEIIESYNGKCPNCGKKLSYIPIDTEVKPADETKQLKPLEPESKRPSRKRELG